MARIASYRGSARTQYRTPLLTAGLVTLGVLFALVVALYARSLRSETPRGADEASTRAAVWCERESCYWISRGGLITETAPDTDGGLVIVFTSTRGRDLRQGARVVRFEEAERLFEIVEMLARAKLRISEARVDTERSREVIVLLASGERLLFSTRFSSLFAEPILEALSAQGIFSGLRYIDFRSENRAYYQ